MTTATEKFSGFFFLFPIHYLSQQSKCKNLALWIMRNVCVIPWRTLHLWSNEKIILWQINWSTVTASDVILLQHFSDYLKVWPPLDSVLFATWESPRRKMNELNKDLFSHRKALVGLMNHFLTCLTFTLTHSRHLPDSTVNESIGLSIPRLSSIVVLLWRPSKLA